MSDYWNDTERDYGLEARKLRTEIERLRAIERAARLLIADVRERHPEQELYCPFMRALDSALGGKSVEKATQDEIRK